MIGHRGKGLVCPGNNISTRNSDRTEAVVPFSHRRSLSRLGTRDRVGISYPRPTTCLLKGESRHKPDGLGSSGRSLSSFPEALSRWIRLSVFAGVPTPRKKEREDRLWTALQLCRVFLNMRAGSGVVLLNGVLGHTMVKGG
jgi:hypothetical protein